MTLSNLKISANISGKVTKSPTDGSTQIDDYTESLARNTEIPSDANLLYHTKMTVTNGGSQNIDLSGTLEDALGQSCVFSKVYAFLIVNLNTSTGNVVRVGNSNWATWLGSATDYVVVGPKGHLCLSSPVDGYAVTASTADILTIANPGGTSINIRVVIVGKS